MTITLPSGLTWAMEHLGFFFPDSDEDKLDAMGQSWIRFATTMEPLIAEADRQAQAVKNDNQGEAIATFWEVWSGATGPAACLRANVEGARLIGAGLSTAAGIVYALKVKVIAEVTLFVRTCWIAAQAAKTPLTAVLAVATVVAVRLLVVAAITAAFNLAIQALLRE
jgi:hypothetical protein